MKQKINNVLKLLFVWFLVHSILIVIDGLWDETSPCEFVVILGNTVNEDGSLSPRLKARVDKGLQLYQTGHCQQLIVSGGLGKEGHLEGDVMAAYLIQQGVPDSVIVIDNKGVNTKATANYVGNMLPKKINPITIVSQYYHISRTKLAFQKLGFTNVQGVHADYFELRDIYSIFREFFGYYKYWLF